MPKDTLDELFETWMAEAAEDECAAHVHPITIAYVCDPRERRHSRRRIAALLRLLAEYTDGFCAARDSLDADLTRPTGIGFNFSSVEKRKAFRVRVGRYLNADVVACLNIVDG